MHLLHLLFSLFDFYCFSHLQRLFGKNPKGNEFLSSVRELRHKRTLKYDKNETTTNVAIAVHCIYERGVDRIRLITVELPSSETADLVSVSSC